MRELFEQLYLTRREFLKLGIAGVAVSTGCVDAGKYFDEYFVSKTPTPTVKPTPSPKEIKQQEWIERYNKAYGANLTLADLPLPSEKAVHKLKMYEGMREGVDFVEPEIGNGKAYFRKEDRATLYTGGYREEYPGFEKIVRSALDLLKEKDYLDYVFVCKNSKRIEYSGIMASRVKNNNILIGHGGLYGYNHNAGFHNQSAIGTAGHIVHEAVHLEQNPLLDSGIIIRNSYEDPLGGLSPEIVAYRAEGEFYRTIGIDIDVDEYVTKGIRHLQ